MAIQRELDREQAVSELRKLYMEIEGDSMENKVPQTLLYRANIQSIITLLAETDAQPEPHREPCPFCGAEGPVILSDYNRTRKWMECGECGARGPRSVAGDAGDELSRLKWNSRDV